MTMGFIRPMNPYNGIGQEKEKLEIEESPDPVIIYSTANFDQFRISHSGPYRLDRHDCADPRDVELLV